MLRKPREPGASLVSRRLLWKSLVQGLAIFAASFGSYAYLYCNGTGTSEVNAELARTFALLVVGFASLFLVYVNQSEKRFALVDMFKFKDKVIWYVNAGILAVWLLVIYTPFGQNYAKTVPLGVGMVGMAIGLAFVSTFWWEIVKLFSNRTKKD